MKKWGVFGVMVVALAVGVVLVRQPARLEPDAAGEGINCGWCGMECVNLAEVTSCASEHVHGYSCNQVGDTCVKDLRPASQTSGRAQVVMPDIAQATATTVATKKVFVLIFNPLINGQN